MPYRSVLALLFAFAVSSYAAELWSGNATISTNAPYNHTFGPFNLYDYSTLTLTYSQLVQVCIVYAEFGLPHWTQYGDENCLVYLNTTKAGGESIEKLPLLQLSYQIGVFFANPDDKTNTTVHVSLAGNNCAQQTEYWDGAACVGATVLKPMNDSWTATFTKGETKFYTYETGVGLSHMTFAMTGKEEGISAENVIITARYAAGAYILHDQTDNNGTLTIISPRQGMWVFAVHAAEAGSADFTLGEFACGAKSAGEGCVIPVREPFTNMSITMTPEDGWMFLRFVVDEKSALLVSLTTNNGSNLPYIYANRGQIPTKATDGTILADIHNCNREYCDVVRSIVRNITLPKTPKTKVQAGPEDWYIAIFTTTPGNTTFALWWNQTCVPDCDTDNHGECLDSGRCLCEIDFEGIDCSVSKGLGPQYIVLIIIASLVVASAIIGFVAWAYMRRKRNNYEIVS
jgi:hypothetical protein